MAQKKYVDRYGKEFNDLWGDGDSYSYLFIPVFITVFTVLTSLISTGLGMFAFWAFHIGAGISVSGAPFYRKQLIKAISVLLVVNFIMQGVILGLFLSYSIVLVLITTLLMGIIMFVVGINTMPTGNIKAVKIKKI
ncbi:MAG: hypothetical protein ACXAD7_05450 [Candidatus Kariarchaeaceae archaeon]|jgi:membrane protein insertase Oxa1/YidC/SpoIIIJ